MKKIFPEADYELHPLSEEHPVWRAKHLLTPTASALGHRAWLPHRRHLLAARTSPATGTSPNAARQPAVIKAAKVGQNVMDYATGSELPADKLAVRDVPDFEAEPAKRGALHIAKLRHAGEWNVAPMAIPNLRSVLRKPPLKFDVVVNHKELFPRDPNLIYYPLDLHARPCGVVVPARRHRRRCGVTSSRAAACCSRTRPAAARRSTRRFASWSAELYPDTPLVPIPPDDDIYTKKCGFDLSDVPVHQGGRGGQGFPQLEGVKINGHWVIIYSKYDLGCAMERQQGLECKGYTHEIALKIAANIVIYSTLP